MKNKALNLPYKLLIILSIFAILPACSSSDDDDDASNSAPSVSAGEDQTVNQGATVDLVGVASDSDGSISSWLWKQTSGSHSVTIKNSTTSNAYFSAPTVDTETTLVFELEVKDNDGASVSDSMRVTVLGPGDSVNPLPDNFEAEAGDGQVTLTWTHHSGATYNIYRSSDPNCELANYTTCTYGALFTSKSSGFVDDDLTNGTNYYYWIEAILDGFTYLDEEAVNATPEDGEDNIDLTDGLVAHYEFDGDADDSSGNGNDGEDYGGVSYVDGVIGQAANFYDSDGHIGIENDFSLNDFAVAFYAKIDAENSAQNFFFQASQSSKDNILGLAYEKGLIHLQYESQGETLYISQYEYDLLAAGWTHFTLQTNNNTGVDLYIDGDKVTTFDVTQSEILLEYIVLAQEQDCFRGCFDSRQRLIGSLDDFRIYNRALNLAEVQALYEFGQEDTTSLSEGLIAHYEFEDDAGDSSGNGNDGEDYGGVSYVDGVIGQAANFYDSDGHIGIENDFSLNDFAVAFYAKIDAENSAQNFFFQASQSSKDNILGLAYEKGLIHLQYESQGETLYISQYEYDLLAAGWTHFTLQTNNNTGVDLYIDGDKVTTFDVTQSEILLEYIVLAQEQDCFRGCFDSRQRLIGSLDDFRIYNRALSAEEIQTLYELGDD